MFEDRVVKTKLNWRMAVFPLLMLLAIGLSAHATQFSPSNLLQPGNIKAITRFVGGLWPPALDIPFIKITLALMLETIAIATLGTFLAVICGFPLAILTTRPQGEEFSRQAQGSWYWTLRWTIYYLVRSILNILRAIPELVWALIFVVAVGLGPVPGVLALAAHSTGILGKLYAEVFESADNRLVEMVRVTGASELKVLLYARLPLTLPLFVSYTLFRWECNLRAATLLGFVGAGGLGAQLIISLKLFRYDEVMTLILAILMLVALIELLGQIIRRRLIEAPQKPLPRKSSQVA